MIFVELLWSDHVVPFILFTSFVVGTLLTLYLCFFSLRVLGGVCQLKLGGANLVGMSVPCSVAMLFVGPFNRCNLFSMIKKFPFAEPKKRKKEKRVLFHSHIFHWYDG